MGIVMPLHATQDEISISIYSISTCLEIVMSDFISSHQPLMARERTGAGTSSPASSYLCQGRPAAARSHA